MISFAILGVAKGPFIPNGREDQVVRECRLTLVGYLIIALACCLVDIYLLFLLWIGPILLEQCFLRMYLLCEHKNCEDNFNTWENVQTIEAGRFENWLTWNMPYHTEYRLFLQCRSMPCSLSKVEFKTAQNTWVEPM